jgi:hypothetical protein
MIAVFREILKPWWTINVNKYMGKGKFGFARIPDMVMVIIYLPTLLLKEQLKMVIMNKKIKVE